MNILGMLSVGPKTFRGEGVNHENERFVGVLKIEALENGRAVMLSYSAKLENGTVVHSESTLLGTGSDGKLCLWPVMSEVPVVLPHTEVMNKSEPGKRTLVVFGSGARDDSAIFREEITIEYSEEGSLVYGHAWGLPGGTFEERSSCRMVPSGA